MKFRYLIVTAVAVVAAIGLSLSQTGIARATDTASEFVLDPSQDGYPSSSGDGGWCLTAPYTTVGSAIYLGDCANAQSQSVTQVVVNTSDQFELQFGNSALCVTLESAPGRQDGTDAVVGKCIAAATQIFSPINDAHGDLAWVTPDISDDNGFELAVDDAGNVLAAWNPIDSSATNPPCSGDCGITDDTYPQEDWATICDGVSC